MFHCFNCQAPWESTLRQPAVKETCEQCGAYLHCCKNCRFHRQGYPNACFIPDTEKIADKRRANFCDEFEFRPANAESSGAQTRRAGLAEVWGEDGENKCTDIAPDGIEEWLLKSDSTVKDFKDLFDD